LDATGADALRWYLFTASHPGEPRRFSDRLVNETLRRVLLTLWNVYSFFTNYANIDGFDPGQIPQDWKPGNELDRWILSELNLLVAQVDDHLEHYSPTDAGRRIQEFIDGLSNWYVRRSRRRFWRSENDGEKLSAHATLYQCLVTVAKLMAPLAPFMAEEIYQNLVRSSDPSAPASVHLAAFPTADDSLVDQSLMDATRLAMRISSMGRAARSKAGLKVRQPLPAIVVKTRLEEEEQYLGWVESQVLEELNVKALHGVSHQPGIYDEARATAGDNTDAILSIGNYSVNLEAGYMVAVDASVTPELAREGLAREVAHRIQNLRRSANFDITDRIVTYYDGPEDLARVMQVHASYISDETLSDELVAGDAPEEAKSETQKIEGMEVTLGVRRV
jgi:isoleucyl-tRNA synthetase